METDTFRKIKENTDSRWLEVKRDVSGAVVFKNVGSQSTTLTAGQTKTLTTTIPDRLLAQKMVLGFSGFTTLTYTLKVDGNTLLTGTGGTGTVTTSQLSDLKTPVTFTAVCKAAAGSGTVTFTASREDRWI